MWLLLLVATVLGAVPDDVEEAYRAGDLERALALSRELHDTLSFDDQLQNLLTQAECLMALGQLDASGATLDRAEALLAGRRGGRGAGLRLRQPAPRAAGLRLDGRDLGVPGARGPRPGPGHDVADRFALLARGPGVRPGARGSHAPQRGVGAAAPPPRLHRGRRLPGGRLQARHLARRLVGAACARGTPGRRATGAGCRTVPDRSRGS